jgi:transglutaminase-like putative cysteine protease
MAIRVALNHRTAYRFDRLVELSPHIIRLWPAPHTRTPILSRSLRVTPSQHFMNWQQDPYSNYLARVVFPEKSKELTIEMDLVAEMTVINPFDFFVEPDAIEFPFKYDQASAKQLVPFFEVLPAGQKLAEWLEDVPRKKISTIDFIVMLNLRLFRLAKKR